MTSLTDSEGSEARQPAAAIAAGQDRPQGRAMLRSLCLHASILAALAVARIVLPPLDAFDPRKIEVTIAEAPQKPTAPGTADDPDSGSQAGASGAAAKAEAEPAPAAPAVAETPKPAEPAAPQKVERAKPPPKPRPPKPVVAQAERPPQPPTAPVAQPKPLPTPLVAPIAPEATAPAPHALVAPTPPPPEITRSQPPPPSIASTAPAPSASSLAGGSSATGTGAGIAGSGPGAASAGSGSGAGSGYGGPGLGSGRGDEYLAALRRWIMRYHHYPDGARAVGVATIGFQIAADGTVSHISLEHSSGDSVIDRDALNLLHRASPVPPPPPERLRDGHVELAIPVQYEPGFFERLFR